MRAGTGTATRGTTRTTSRGPGVRAASTPPRGSPAAAGALLAGRRAWERTRSREKTRTARVWGSGASEARGGYPARQPAPIMIPRKPEIKEKPMCRPALGSHSDQDMSARTPGQGPVSFRLSHFPCPNALESTCS